MLATTLDIIRSGLKADPSLTPADRARVLAFLRSSPNPVRTPSPESNKPCLLRRDEVARRLACSLRMVDKLAAEGVLKKVTLPGRKRGAGFLEADIAALIEGDDRNCAADGSAVLNHGPVSGGQT